MGASGFIGQSTISPSIYIPRVTDQYIDLDPNYYHNDESIKWSMVFIAIFPVIKFGLCHILGWPGSILGFGIGVIIPIIMAWQSNQFSIGLAIGILIQACFKTVLLRIIIAIILIGLCKLCDVKISPPYLTFCIIYPIINIILYQILPFSMLGITSFLLAIAWGITNLTSLILATFAFDIFLNLVK